MADYQPQSAAAYPRHLAARVRMALTDTPVVLVHGPRQAGKSTLVQSLISKDYPARYVTFDDALVLGAARAGPADFLASLKSPVIIDEVQRAPEILLAIKAEVDRRREPGRYLLTGSAHVRFVPEVAEALAGRVEMLTLWPLSQGEIEGRTDGFVDRVFRGDVPDATEEPLDRVELLDRAVVGGYPEVVQRREAGRRQAWFSSYITTVLQREVRDLAEIERLTELPRLLALIASRAGGLQNFSELARASSMPQTTLKRYLALLQATFLVDSLPAWSGNLGKRLIKSPKLYPVDSGLMAYILGLEPEGFDVPGAATGALLETFVIGELRKQIGWSEVRPSMHHFRSAGQEEIDLLLEDRSQRVVAIEIKASSALDRRDFRHLRRLREDLGTKFVKGFVLHPGRESAAFDRDLQALPLSTLWRSAPKG